MPKNLAFCKFTSIVSTKNSIWLTKYISKIYLIFLINFHKNIKILVQKAYTKSKYANPITIIYANKRKIKDQSHFEIQILCWQSIYIYIAFIHISLTFFFKFGMCSCHFIYLFIFNFQGNNSIFRLVELFKLIFYFFSFISINRFSLIVLVLFELTIITLLGFHVSELWFIGLCMQVWIWPVSFDPVCL